MSLTKSVTKWWWGWEPEKIEDWLEQMEVEGWHLYNATGIGVRFHFVKEEPRRVRYCADYQSKIGPQYKEIFQDTGWELVYSGMGWYIWRMEYVGERPDIYTDIDSILDRNKRLITLLGIITIIEGFALTSMGATHEYQSDISSIIVMYAVLFSFIGYCMYKLLAYNNRLKAKKRL
jgi:hypothetical protein